MDTEERRDRLYQIASSDPDPARRAKARELLKTLPTKSADTGQRPESHRGGETDPEPGGPVTDRTHYIKGGMLYPEPDPGRTITLDDIKDTPRALNEPGNQDLVSAVSLPVNAFLGGVPNMIADAAIPGHREAREDFVSRNPNAATLLSAAGALSPASVPSKIGGAADRGITAVAERVPLLRRLLGIPVLGNTLRGVGVGATVGAEQGAAEGHPLEGAKQGAVVGSVMGGGSDIAGRAADALQTEDIALLEKYGLRPSMVPGAPVAEQGRSGLRALAKPPTGVRTASPATRETAGLASGDVIGRNLAEREVINNERIGEHRADNDIKYGKTAPPRVRGTAEEPPPDDEEQTVDIPHEQMQALVYGLERSPVRPVRDALDALRRRADLPDATRGRLGEVGRRLDEISDPGVEVSTFDPDKVVGPDGMKAGELVDMLSKSAARVTGPQRAALQAEIDRITEMASTKHTLANEDATANPVDMQGLKALARNLGHADKVQGVNASESALRSVGAAANEALPEEMQAQDREYHEARRRTELAKESVGLSRRGRIPLESDVPSAADEGDVGEADMDFADPRTVEQIADHLTRRGEDTKAGAKATNRTQYLYDNGMPEVMPGARTPEEISVRSLMDVPRLQLAQERLQLNPSHIFSGGSVPGALGRLVKSGTGRTLYPMLRGAGNADVPARVGGGNDIINILRLRMQLFDAEEEQKAKAAEEEMAAQ